MNRCVTALPCTDEDVKVIDVTQWLGLLDGIGVLLVMAFGLMFLKYKIPRVTVGWDNRTVTPADYTIEVYVLPRQLSPEDHPEYRQQLQMHFLRILRDWGVEETHDAEPIYDIVCARDYAGAISIFMSKGALLLELENEKELHRRYLEAQKSDPKAAKKVAKIAKRIAKREEKIDGFDRRLKQQADLSDEMR